MTTQTEALKLALEALKDNQHLVADNERHLYVMEYNSIIEKCKEVLANHIVDSTKMVAQQSNEQVEPAKFELYHHIVLKLAEAGCKLSEQQKMVLCNLKAVTHPPVPTAQPDLIKNERDKLRAFAQEIMDGWPDVGMLDGFDLQELAVKHGLLAETTRHKPCVEEGCNCAEMVDEQDWQEGVKCYRSTDLLKGVA